MKRGSSGLSLLLGIDKDVSRTSHDVVSEVRRIFEEKRVGHAGTLDPLASGVLPIMVGSATRLDTYLSGQGKAYIARIAFGRSTTTDDSEGETLHEASVPSYIFDPDFIRQYLDGLVGEHMQLPPIYSAIKVNGKRAYEEARRGNIIELKPRKVEIRAARLVGFGSSDDPYWDIEVHVSKGTYIRSLARDIGNDLRCYAHIASLRRILSGNIGIDDCVPIDVVLEEGTRAAIDPVKALDYRFAFIDDVQYAKVKNGGFLDPNSLALFDYDRRKLMDACCCTSSVLDSDFPLENGELIQLIFDNKLCAIYKYLATKQRLVPECVFQIDILRGTVL